MSEEKSKLEAEQFSKIKDKIKLILLGINALKIENEKNITIPNDEVELPETKRKIIALVGKNKELIRRACGLLEEIKQRNQPIDSYGIIKDYWEYFNAEYPHQFTISTDISVTEMENLAIKILFELLFYTGVMGENRLQQQLYFDIVNN